MRNLKELLSEHPGEAIISVAILVALLAVPTLSYHTKEMAEIRETVLESAVAIGVLGWITAFLKRSGRI